MNFIIKNRVLTVAISTKGAEFQSILHKDCEYLWQGDPKVWAGRAPLLFPIVGGLKNKEYLHKGKKYSMPNHGIARINDFKISQISDQEILCTLVDNKATRAMYPFSFKLEITYKVIEHKIHIEHRFTNTSDEVMPFVFGLHPAFNLHDSLENSHIQFDNESLISTLDTEEGFFVSKTRDYGVKTLNFNKHSFDKDNTIVFDNLKSRQAKLMFKNSDRAISMKWTDDLPILAIWSKAGAPYICIEPWCGIADCAEDTINELSQKRGMILLGVDESKDIAYEIEVF